MVSTPVLKLASAQPRLAHLLSLIGSVSAFRAHVHLARTLVKCILYIALGPRAGKHLTGKERAERRAVALKWASDQLALIRRDRIQSEFYFINNAIHSPKPQLSMMTDLGFARSVLSASVIQKLVSQLLSKLDAIDAVIQNNPLLVQSWSNEQQKDQHSINTSKYCQLRHTISIKCVPLLENGLFALPLAERIITSPVRRQLPNNWTTTPSSSSSTIGNEEEEKRTCICGMSNMFIDKLFANTAIQFQKLDLAARASLLIQCPKALTIEIERAIKRTIARPFASKHAIQGIAENLIEAAFQSLPVFVHWSSILRQLIQASTHPSIIILYHIAAESISRRLQEPKLAKGHLPSLSSYWPSTLVQLLSLHPKSPKQYYALNSSLEQLIGQHILEDKPSAQLLPSPQASPASVWFTILSFHVWIEKAYEMIADNIDSGNAKENEEIFKFLVWHAHPILASSRTLAFQELVNYCGKIALLNSEVNMIMIEEEKDIIRSALESHPLVHPLLIHLWKPTDSYTLMDFASNENADTSRIGNVVAMALQLKSPTLSVSSILDFLDANAATIQNSSSMMEREKKSKLVSQAASTLTTALKAHHPSIYEIPDVRSRLESFMLPLFASNKG